MRASLGKLVLVALAATVAVAAAIDELEREKCLIRAREIDSQLEDDGDALIEYVNDSLVCSKPVDECLRQDQQVSKGVAAMVERVKQLGEANGCAEGLYALGTQSNLVKREMAKQLRQTIREVHTVLGEMNEKIRALFGLILESCETEAKRLV